MKQCLYVLAFLLLSFLCSAKAFADPFSDRNIELPKDSIVSAYVFLFPGMTVPIEFAHEIPDEELMLLEITLCKVKSPVDLYSKAVFLYLHQRNQPVKLSVVDKQDYMCLNENGKIYGVFAKRVETVRSFDGKELLKSAYFRVPPQFKALMEVFDAKTNLLELTNAWSLPDNIKEILPKIKYIYTPQMYFTVQNYATTDEEKLPEGVSSINSVSYLIRIENEANRGLDMLAGMIDVLSRKTVRNLQILIGESPEKQILDISQLHDLKSLYVYVVPNGNDWQPCPCPIEIKVSEKASIETLCLTQCTIAVSNLRPLLKNCISFSAIGCTFNGSMIEAEVEIENVLIYESGDNISKPLLLTLIAKAKRVVYHGSGFPIFQSDSLEKLSFSELKPVSKQLTLNLRGHKNLRSVIVRGIPRSRKEDCFVEVKLPDSYLTRDVSFSVYYSTIIRFRHETGEFSVSRAPVCNIFYYTKFNYMLLGHYFFP